MVSVWAELLQIDPDRLGPASDFFSLGGNSLLATRLINLLQQQAGVELPVEAVFNAPKLAAMAAELERRIPAAVQAGTDELDRILESIGLIEAMSDEELDALGIEN